MSKKITKQDINNFIIEETKQQEVKQTQYINVPQLKRQIEVLEVDIAELTSSLSEKKAILKEIKKIK